MAKLKTFNLFARYRDESRRAIDGTTLCEYRGTIEAANITEAKARFAAIATSATGFAVAPNAVFKA